MSARLTQSGKTKNSPPSTGSSRARAWNFASMMRSLQLSSSNSSRKMSGMWAPGRGRSLTDLWHQISPQNKPMPPSGNLKQAVAGSPRGGATRSATTSSTSILVKRAYTRSPSSWKPPKSRKTKHAPYLFRLVGLSGLRRKRRQPGECVSAHSNRWQRCRA